MGSDSAALPAAHDFDRVFSADMRGKSVLTVATAEGAWCVEALRRGAVRAVGVEIDEGARQAAAARAVSNGVPAEFSCVDLDRWCPDEAFDYVVCGSPVSRVRDPFLLLDRLVDASRERLALDLDGAAQLERELRLRWWHKWLLRGLQDVPLVFVNRQPLRQARQPYYLSAPALLCLLREHRAVFHSVALHRVPGAQRQLVVADRRRIARLIVIAGPTSSGKSTLIARLREGQAPAIEERLGLAGHPDWESAHVHDIASDTREELPTVVMHYDFLARLLRNDEAFRHRAFVDVARCARELVVVTLWTDPRHLREQFEQSEIRGYVNSRGVEPTNPKTLQLARDYQDPQAIIEYYASWFRFVSTMPGDHLVLTQALQPEFLSLDQWRSRHGAWAELSRTASGVRNGSR
jgi:hypothetical protein